MSFSKTFFHIYILLFPTIASGASTFAAPPASKAADGIERMDLRSQIPRNPDAYNYEVSDQVYSNTKFEGDIPVFSYNQMGKRIKVGTISPGSAVQIDRFRLSAGRYFFGTPSGGAGISMTTATQPPEFVFVDSKFIKIVSKRDI